MRKLLKRNSSKGSKDSGSLRTLSAGVCQDSIPAAHGASDSPWLNSGTAAAGQSPQQHSRGQQPGYTHSPAQQSYDGLTHEQARALEESSLQYALEQSKLEADR